jgi:Spy/CpxP family protein refolding chaperone
VAIITEAEVKADSVMQRSVEIEQELIDSSFDDRFDEEKVRVLSEQQATMLTQLIVLRVLTKAKFYKILTPEQRALVLQYFRPKAQLQGYLGSISIY